MKIKELQREKEFDGSYLPTITLSLRVLFRWSQILRDGSIGEITSIDIAFENLLKSYRSQTDFREHTENGIR